VRKVRSDVKGHSINGKTVRHGPYCLQTVWEHLLPPAAPDLLCLRVREEHADEKVQLDTQETKELWLATDYHYVPVKILMVDDNGQKLEQTLTELHIE
jgi:hypothetical protein